MIRPHGARGRAQDVFDVMCRLYGDAHVAQALMGVHGACDEHVARLVCAMRRCASAVRAAREYQRLSSLPEGFGRLMAAAGSDGRVACVVRACGGHRRFSRWEIGTAVSIVIKLD